jgi:ssDNA-binding Zn-finger/Zn-ribbon topoisomerase 1
MALDNIPYSLRAIARAIAQGSAGTNEIKTLNQIAAFIGGPTCPKCGVSLVKKFVRRTGEPFWGCPTFPDCRGTRPCRDGTPPRPPLPETEEGRLAREYDALQRDVVAKTLECTGRLPEKSEEEELPF